MEVNGRKGKSETTERRTNDDQIFFEFFRFSLNEQTTFFFALLSYHKFHNRLSFNNHHHQVKAVGTVSMLLMLLCLCVCVCVFGECILGGLLHHTITPHSSISLLSLPLSCYAAT